MRQNVVNHVIKLFAVAHKQCDLTMGLKFFWSSIENIDTFVAEAEHKIVRVGSNSGTLANPAQRYINRGLLLRFPILWGHP